MKFVVFLISLLFFFSALITNAQGTVNGCLLNNRVHTPTGLLGGYTISVSVPLSIDYCSWSPSNGSNCGVCPGALSAITGLCLVNTIPGVRGSFTMVACPIDDYAWLLVVSSASMLFFKIRNRKD